MEKDFISQILEKIGYLAAFAVAFSQYFLRDSFRIFFEADPKIYSVSSLFALLVSIVVIIAVFSNRYTIGLDIYFSKKKKDEYFRKLREQNVQSQGQPVQYIEKPKSTNLKQIALIFLVLSLVLFCVFIYFDNLVIRAFAYVGLVVVIVTSITIYATGLYLENDWKQSEKNKREAILIKIKEYFAGDIKIKLSWRDESNVVRPLQRMIIEREGRSYNVVVNANDPERFFSVEPIGPHAQTSPGQ